MYGPSYARGRDAPPLRAGAGVGAPFYVAFGAAARLVRCASASCVALLAAFVNASVRAKSYVASLIEL